mmetsp:Transcript_22949/g.51750  ORF Transcript_22949/g.51750 Transcript_22949/m.51750 type:complete len:139 (+) Transcript_22949:334-750(+)
MVRNFRALQEFLEYRYPELRGRVHGSNYPPPQFAMLLVQLAALLQWSAIALMIAGDKVFAMVGTATPPWAKSVMENKMNTFIGIFFFNSMAQSMTATGAFEVVVDGKQVFSKLATGRMPSAADITRGLEAIGLHALEH